ncbi:MAG: L-threonylcarbamoyladenylate synthase [Gammaproteobacteria bacterium]
MARFLEVHPDNPQPHRLKQAADIIRSGGIVVFPTDSCYALACLAGNTQSVERMRRLKQLDKKHLYTLICKDLKDLSKFAQVDNMAYRLLKTFTPGPYTFILKASREVPNRLQTKKRKTIGIRVPDHAVAQGLLDELDAPLLSTTAELPGSDLPLNDAIEISDVWGHGIDVILDAGSCGIEHTTIVDISTDVATVVREGKGSVELLVD